MSKAGSGKSWKTAAWAGGFLVAALLAGYCLYLASSGERAAAREKPAADGDPGRGTAFESSGSGEEAWQGEPDDAARLLGTGEISLLEHAELGTADGARYVALDSPSGLWALAAPGDASRAAGAREGRPVRLSRDRIRFSFHTSLVRGGCIHAVVESAREDRVAWTDSRGSRGQAAVPTGGGTVELSCLSGGIEDGPYRISLSLPEKAGKVREVTLRGMWIVPGAGAAPPAAAANLEKCRSGHGWRLEPGGRLIFPVLASKGRRLYMAALGDGSERLEAGFALDEHATKKLPLEPDGEKKIVQGDWELPVDSMWHPAELEVSLPGDAPGGVCLSKLAVRYEKSPPLVTGRPASVDGVVFVLVDTLRADELRAIDAGSKVGTPKLDELAAQSVLFTRTTAHSHYTKPSVGTILTGVYPHVHGSLNHAARMRPSVPLLSELLQKAGVDTQGIFSNHFLNNRKFGFMKGWNFDDHVNSFKACQSGDLVAEKVARWAERWEPRGPYFVYIHLMDPHAPYSPPPRYEAEYVGFRVKEGRFLPLQTAEFLRKFRRGDEPPPTKEELRILKELYNADVAHADFILQKTLEPLEKKGILDRSLLIVTSDHGEEFMEHGGAGHGTNLHKELVHVPMLMRWPRGAVKGTVKTRVGHIDLAPTILDVFDLPRPANMKAGRNLLDLLGGDRAAWEKRAYLVEHKNEKEKGVVTGDWRLLASKREVKLSHITGGSEKDLDVAAHPITWRYLRRRLAGLISGSGEDGESASMEVELSEEEIEKLRAIGYII